VTEGRKPPLGVEPRSAAYEAAALTLSYGGTLNLHMSDGGFNFWVATDRETEIVTSHVHAGLRVTIKVTALHGGQRPGRRRIKRFLREGMESGRLTRLLQSRMADAIPVYRSCRRTLGVGLDVAIMLAKERGPKHFIVWHNFDTSRVLEMWP
jgi:hypothetical protein